MKLRLSSLALLFTLALPHPAPAATESLSLSDALTRAVAGNLDLQRERVTIDIADANVMSARGAFDFRLDGSTIFTRQTQAKLGANDLSAGSTRQLALNLGMTRPLETGGSVSLGVGSTLGQSDQRGACGVDFSGNAKECNFYNSNVSLSVTHPLLRGFGSEIAQANLRRQRILKDQALLNRQTRASNVVRDVITAYWELSYATQDLAIQQAAVELAREQLRITKAQIEVGRLAKIDEAAVQRAIGERLQAVALAEQTLYFQSLELRHLLGLPPDTAAPAFAAADAPTGEAASVDPALEVRNALEVNPQLKSLRMGLTLTEVDIDTALSTVKPRLDFVGSFGSASRNEDFSVAIENTAKLKQLTWSAGLQFQIPIENRTARGQLQAARLTGQRTRIDASVFEIELRELVLQLTSRIQTAARRIQLARDTVGYAEQNLEAEKARFSVGRSTNNDVLLRQQELRNEQIRLVRATVDLLESETALHAATGEILDRHKVALK